MLSEITQEAYLFNLDTGYQFLETLDTRQRLMDKYGLSIHLVRADQSVAAMEAANTAGTIYGTRARSMLPHPQGRPPGGRHQGLRGMGLRYSPRPDGGTRRNQPIVGWDPKFDLVKINPLANWSKRDVWDYILKNDVPYNPLHDQGYPSVGCWTLHARHRRGRGRPGGPLGGHGQEGMWPARLEYCGEITPTER